MCEQKIDRRKFLKKIGEGALLSTAAMVGCKPQDSSAVKLLREVDVPTDKMTYRTDPKNGNKISLLGYGCMRLPRHPIENRADGENDLDQEAINDSVDYALAHGVNYFDTSPVYCKGYSEHTMGIALSRHPREKYFLATKMSNQIILRDSTLVGERSREVSLDIYKNSLKELKTDYFDYYLVHSVGNMEAYKKRYLDNGILDFLLAEREAGRIRSLGWSFHGQKEFFDYMMSSGVKWDFVQIQLNYFDWETTLGRSTANAKYLYEELAKRNIPAVIMEPLLGGRLSSLNYKAHALLRQMDSMASFASWAFRYAGSFENVLTVLSGMELKEHLQDNICTYSPLKPITQEEDKILQQVALTLHEFRNINCNKCQYCMPCPYGLDIPGIFVHYNRCLNEGNFPDNPKDENYVKARRAFLVGYDRSVPKLRQAAHCTGCGDCVKECPQFIPIPDEMVRIDKFVEQLKLNS